MLANNMNRRQFLKSMATLSAVTVLAACQPARKPEPDVPSEPKVEKEAVEAKPAVEKVTIRIQTPAQPRKIELVNKMIDEYEQKHPNVDVISEETIYGEITTRTETGFISGTLPDLCYGHTRWYFINCYRGIYRSIDDLIMSSPPVDFDDFFPLVMETNKFEGEQYCLPDVVHPGGNHIFVWNKSILDKAGVEPPEPTGHWTWDDLGEMATKCTNPDQGIFGTGLVVNAMHYFENISRCWGDPSLEDQSGWQLSPDGRTFQFESPVCEEVSRMYLRLREARVIPRAEDQIEGGLFVAGRQAFAPGVVRYGREVERLVGDAFEIGWALHPVGPEGRFGTCHSGNQWSISSISENPDAAWDVIKALTDPEIAVWGSLTGAVSPGRRSAWVHPEVARDVPAFPASIDMVDTSLEPFCMPWNLRFHETGDVYRNESDLIWDLEYTYEAYASTVNSKVQAILDLDRPPKVG